MLLIMLPVAEVRRENAVAPSYLLPGLPDRHDWGRRTVGALVGQLKAEKRRRTSNAIFDAMRPRLLAADVHPQDAPAEVDQAFGFVGDELGLELVEAVATGADDPGLAQNAELFGGGIRRLARALGQLQNHQLLPAG